VHNPQPISIDNPVVSPIENTAVVAVSIIATDLTW